MEASPTSSDGEEEKASALTPHQSQKPVSNENKDLKEEAHY